MANKNEALIRELHERLMNEFLEQIVESISDAEEHTAQNRGITKDNSEKTIITSKSSATSLGEHGGHDKINEIRNVAAATQAARKNKPVEILNPDKQKELLEIVKQKCEEFERELRRTSSGDRNVFDSESQKFKDELRSNAQKKLTESKFAFTH